MLETRSWFASFQVEGHYQKYWRRPPLAHDSKHVLHIDLDAADPIVHVGNLP